MPHDFLTEKLIARARETASWHTDEYGVCELDSSHLLKFAAEVLQVLVARSGDLNEFLVKADLRRLTHELAQEANK